MLSLCVPPWEICRWHSVSRVSLVHGFSHTLGCWWKCQQDSTGGGDKPLNGSHKTTDPERQGNSSRTYFKTLPFLSSFLLFCHISNSLVRRNNGSFRIHPFITQIINVLDLNCACYKLAKVNKGCATLGRDPICQEVSHGQEQICQGENICRKNVIYTSTPLCTCVCVHTYTHILLQHTQFV